MYISTMPEYALWNESLLHFLSSFPESVIFSVFSFFSSLLLVLLSLLQLLFYFSGSHSFSCRHVHSPRPQMRGVDWSTS
jgi:hypothetical protein